MTVTSQLTEKGLAAKIAEKYRAQGFEVITEPSNSLIPFDLGNYHPDLIARKSSDEGYIIELKNSISRISVDRYRVIAEIVAQQHGWRFLLITGEDIFSADPQDDSDLVTWEQMLQRQEQAQRFLAIWCRGEAATPKNWFYIKSRHPNCIDGVYKHIGDRPMSKSWSY